MEGVLSHSTSAPDCHGDSNPLCIFPSISLSFFFFFFFFHQTLFAPI
jgi:hypothetical protein